jgi:hypothetical protein
VRWSRGLRQGLFGPLLASEQTNKELAAEDVGGQQVTAIAREVRSRARTAGLDHALRAAAESGGLAAVNALIAGWLQAGDGSRPRS